MMNMKRAGMASLIALGMMFVPASQISTASAAPGVVKTLPNAVPFDESLQKVGRRGHRSRGWRERHWRSNRHHYRDYGWNPGAYVALGVIGALVNHGMNEASARGAMERCDARYRSFEWDTGLYTTYGGDKVLCPYLR